LRAWPRPRVLRTPPTRRQAQQEGSAGCRLPAVSWLHAATQRRSRSPPCTPPTTNYHTVHAAARACTAAALRAVAELVIAAAGGSTLALPVNKLGHPHHPPAPRCCTPLRVLHHPMHAPAVQALSVSPRLCACATLPPAPAAACLVALHAQRCHPLLPLAKYPACTSKLHPSLSLLLSQTRHAVNAAQWPALSIFSPPRFSIKVSRRRAQPVAARRPSESSFSSQ